MARAGDLDARVTFVSRWRARDVVQHLGGVHRWATRVIDEQSMAGPGFHKGTLDGEALADWFDEGLAALLATLRATDPRAACPNFCPGSERTIAWWMRRQAQETVVHRHDVESAMGVETAIDAELAADGVDEYLDVFVRPRGGHELAAPIVLRTEGRAWTVSPAAAAGRVDVARGDQGGVATVEGPADELLLTLWNRCRSSPVALEVVGDRAVVEAFLPAISK